MPPSDGHHSPLAQTPGRGPAHLLGCELPARLVHVLDLHVGFIAVLLLEVLGEAAVLLPPAVLIVDGPVGDARGLSTARHPGSQGAAPGPALTSCPRCSTRPTAGTCWAPSPGPPSAPSSPAALGGGICESPDCPALPTAWWPLRDPPSCAVGRERHQSPRADKGNGDPREVRCMSRATGSVHGRATILTPRSLLHRLDCGHSSRSLQRRGRASRGSGACWGTCGHRH